MYKQTYFDRITNVMYIVFVHLSKIQFHFGEKKQQFCIRHRIVDLNMKFYFERHGVFVAFVGLLFFIVCLIASNICVCFVVVIPCVSLAFAVFPLKCRKIQLHSETQTVP